MGLSIKMLIKDVPLMADQVTSVSFLKAIISCRNLD